MKCRQCNRAETKVLESRESKEGFSGRRRRECQGCGSRFTTFDKSEQNPLTVVKRDGAREVFDRNKVLRSLILACQKRATKVSELEAIASWVERTAGVNEGGEVASSRIGELVLDVLRHLDSVAYVRFASVYRAFSDPEDFVRELRLLAQNSRLKDLPEDFRQGEEGGGA